MTKHDAPGRPHDIVLPSAVRLRAQGSGAAAMQWVHDLPDTVAALERAWSVEVGRVIEGGSEAYVAEAITQTGELAVVKIRMPHDDSFVHEVNVLEVAAGRGYPRLLRRDDARSAILIERLGAPLDSLGLSIDEQIRVVCETLRDAWITIGADLGLPTCAEKAVYLEEFIVQKWAELERPCAESVIDRARAFCDVRRRAFDADDAVLVHGDAHSANTLRVLAPDGGAQRKFKLVDPDGLYGERAYDLAIPMRGWSTQLLSGDALDRGRQRCAYLNRLTDVDADAIWQWGFIERVSTGFALMLYGQRQEGEETLAVAARWL